MKVNIRDRDALLAISPAALSAYARGAGWRREEPYRVHSDVYTGRELPEIIIPRTAHLGDYATVVSTLIETFAEVAGQDETSVYRDLVTSDYDVIPIRALGHDHGGDLSVGVGAEVLCGARDMVLAAACSLDNPQPVYQPAANEEAHDYLRRVRLDGIDQANFVVTLLSPVAPPSLQIAAANGSAQDEPIERQATRRLAEALAAVRGATDDAKEGNSNSFRAVVSEGVRANLCEALATLVEMLAGLDISIVWARTGPWDEPPLVTRFACSDAAILRAAGRVFRSRDEE